MFRLQMTLPSFFSRPFHTHTRFDPASPFGGYKESGFGREGGRHGLEAYVSLDDA